MGEMRNSATIGSTHLKSPGFSHHCGKPATDREQGDVNFGIEVNLTGNLSATAESTSIDSFAKPVQGEDGAIEGAATAGSRERSGRGVTAAVVLVGLFLDIGRA
jgi:hypothetical protein